MCGLVGIFSPQAIPDLASVIARMNQTQHHRGPDQTGLFIHPSQKVALGHKRLSILDLTHGIQPMTDCDQRYTLVFNGEIYNYLDIKADLVAKGHPVHTRSDTETLLYAYKEWGPACLSRLRGMFAFAIYDHGDNSIFLARDRLGIKPLYYGRHSGGSNSGTGPQDQFLFASECKGILEYPGFDRSMDTEALSDYFSFMYVPAPKSIYKKIRKLPAGHWMKVNAQGDIKIQQYWDLEFTVDEKLSSPENAQQALASCLDESVKCHMESDVPLGAFLSGGVDSAAVVALMAKNSGRRILTNTIGFENKDFDESQYAADSAKALNTEHHHYQVEANAIESLEKLAWHYDEPFADSSMIPTYYVCAMAKKNVTVALSGDGGDENFAGYRRYFFDRFENQIRAKVPAALRQSIFGGLGAFYPKADWLPQPLRAKTLLQNLARNPVEGYFTSLTHIHPAMKAQLFSQDLQKSLGGYQSISVFEDHIKNCTSSDPLSRVQYLDFKTYLVDDILTKVDRASMANSLEVRVPLLDHKVVELAARMPSSLKLNGKVGKYIFKETVRSSLPAEIFSRKKSGFSIPISNWFRKEIKDYAEDKIFGSSGVTSLGLFEKPALKKMWDEHQSGISNHSFPLFSILSFALWQKKFGVGG